MSPSTGLPNEDTPLNEAPAREPIAEVAQRLRPRLVASARRVLNDEHEAEDVVQQVMLRAAKCEDEIRSAPAWLFAVTYRVAIDRLRARSRRAQALRNERREPVEAPDDQAAQRERALAVRGHLRRLDDPYRSALSLRYLEGLGFADIAERLDTKERTARTWVARGLAKLRARLGGRA